ncbi:MAG: Holliday junction branch migration protein RuvA [Lachnospiraceae bacterium]|nr:Holliday junction branch migration protein RuvA [Lachnospiraceae bacterium]
MIAYLKGEVVAIYEDQIVLEVKGIGYNIFMPASSLDLIEGLGSEVKVYTYLSVREDAMLLYGFLTKDDLDFYKLLLSVNGVGPKAALSVLSAMNSEDIKFAILSGDSKTISKAPGIGAKTAQRIIIDLKDRVDLREAFESKSEAVLRREGKAESPVQEEAVEALTALGYSGADALRAVRKAYDNPEDDVETLLKKALKHILN